MNNSEKVQFLFNLSSLSEIEKGTTCEFSKFMAQFRRWVFVESNPFEWFKSITNLTQV